MLGESVDCCQVTRRNMISILHGFGEKDAGMQEIQCMALPENSVHPLYIWTSQLGTTISYIYISVFHPRMNLFCLSRLWIFNGSC